MKIDNLIEIFNKVRDIPYRIPIALDEIEGEESGNCLYKVELLKNLFNFVIRLNIFILNSF